MRKRSVWRAASLIIALLSSVSWACAQVPSSAPTETPTGDYWPSDAEYIRLPILGAAELDEGPSSNISPPTTAAPRHATCTARSEYEPPRHGSVRHGAVPFGKHRKALRVVRVHNDVHTRHTLRDMQVSFRCVFDPVDPETRAAP
jgi:hypothetical protein